MTNGEKIRAIREHYKLTIEEMAERLGIVPASLAEIERGTQFISRSGLTRFQLEDIFGMEHDYLNGGSVMIRKGFRFKADAGAIAETKAAETQGSFLRIHREAIGLTQTEVGAICGKSGAMVSNYEQGRCAIPYVLFSAIERKIKVPAGSLKALPFKLPSPTPEPAAPPAKAAEQRTIVPSDGKSEPAAERGNMTGIDPAHILAPLKKFAQSISDLCADIERLAS